MYGGNNRNSAMDGNETIVVAIGLFLIVIVIFAFFHREIVGALLWVKYIELKIIDFFIPGRSFVGLERWVGTARAGSVSYHELFLLSAEVGSVLKYPCFLILLLLSGINYWLHPDSNFNEIETRASLAKKIAGVFPVTKVVEDLNLIKTPLDSGPWAMGMTPVEFARRNKLFIRKSITKKEKNPAIEIDTLRAKMIFSSQLGPRWKGINALTPYQKALFGIFAAFANYQRDEAEKVLEHVAASVKKSHLNKGRHDFSGAGTLLRKYANSTVVKEVTSKHAYVTTVFTELLERARLSGIVANASFLWLKPCDRLLWYTLNNVGRKAVYSEAAGVTAHWKVEKSVGCALADPIVDEAVKGLDEVLKTRVLNEDDVVTVDEFEANTTGENG